MVMDYLQKIMRGIMEDHVDGLVFECDFSQGDDILVLQLSIEGNLSHGTLADAGVSSVLFLVWLELFDGKDDTRSFILRCPCFEVAFERCFVYPAICSTAEEAKDVVCAQH